MSAIPDSRRQGQTEGNVAPKLSTPKLYVVVLHNDDFTTMDFVVSVLVRVFHKSPEEASAVMMDVHNKGEGAAGVYPFDIAVTKKLLAERMAEEKNYPLRITITEAADNQD